MRDVDEQKYRQVILAFLIQCNHELLGKTKLMRFLYSLDVDHFEKYGQPVTGETYVRRQFGPFPRNSGRILHVMEREGLFRRECVTLGAKTRVHYRLTDQGVAAYDPSVFTESEREVLAAVTQGWEDRPPRELVEATHTGAPWKNTPDGEEIPYGLAYVRHKHGGKGLTDVERDHMIRSVISSQALEGVHVSYETASRLLDEVLREPLVKID